MKSVEHGLVWIENGREPQEGSSNVFAEHHVSLVRMCPGAFPQESLQAAPCEENTLHDLLANVVDIDSIPKRSVEVSGGFTPLDLLQGSLYLCKRGFYFYKRVFEKLCLFNITCQRPCCLHLCCLKVCVSWKASSQRTCAVIAIFLESIPCENMLT